MTYMKTKNMYAIEEKYDFPRTSHFPVEYVVPHRPDMMPSDDFIRPSVWGPLLWFSLHVGTTRYPISATPLESEKMQGFILGLPYILPCSECSEHARDYINQRFPEINRITSGRVSLFKFFVDFHNYVNQRFGKKLYSYAEAGRMYNIII
jgi:hypothetical protein